MCAKTLTTCFQFCCNHKAAGQHRPACKGCCIAVSKLTLTQLLHRKLSNRTRVAGYKLCMLQAFSSCRISADHLYVMLCYQGIALAVQEVEVKVLRWLHEEEATGVQYLEVHFVTAGVSVDVSTSSQNPYCLLCQQQQFCRVQAMRIVIQTLRAELKCLKKCWAKLGSEWSSASYDQGQSSANRQPQAELTCPCLSPSSTITCPGHVCY